MFTVLFKRDSFTDQMHAYMHLFVGNQDEIAIESIMDTA